MGTRTDNLDDLFTTIYKTTLIAKYQRMGGRLLGTVSQHATPMGKTVKFRVRGTATTNQRSAPHADITPIAIDYETKEATMAVHYSGEWLDDEDSREISLSNSSHMMAVAEEHHTALMRKVDDVILESMTSIADDDLGAVIGNKAGTVSNGLTLKKARFASEALSDNHVGFNGRTALVSPYQWTELMQLKEFASADYIDSKIWGDRITEKPRVWNGAMWLCIADFLPLNNGVRGCYMYDKSALGCCPQKMPESKMQFWLPKNAHFILDSLAIAATDILPKGVVRFDCAEPESDTRYQDA